MTDDLRARRRPYFFIAAGVLVIVTVAVFRLPELFVDQLRRNRSFSSDQSGWAFRLLALAAFAQAAYVGLVLLREDRVESAWKEDPKLRRLGRGEVMNSLARTAAWTPLLTLVYGGTAFVLTGERAGFWLFVALTAVQLAWSYRQAGQIGVFLGFQPEYVSGGSDSQTRETPEGED